jgi:hypothetical protein
MKKQKLKLNRETIVALDRGQLADVHGGGAVSRSVCISNNGGGHSCGYCPSDDPPSAACGGGGEVSHSVCISNNGGGHSCGWCHGPIGNGGSGW